MNIGVEYLEQHLCCVGVIVLGDRHEPLSKACGAYYGEHLAYSFKGFYGYRNFTIKDEAGEICALRNSVWVYMDTATMRPVRIAKEVQDAYIPVMDEAIQYEWADRKISLPDEAVQKKCRKGTGTCFPFLH